MSINKHYAWPVFAAFVAACTAPVESEPESISEAEDALTNGTTYSLKLSKMSGDTGNCIDVAGAATTNGANVEEWDCNGSGAQTFKAVDAGSGFFQLVNTNSGKCIDITCPNGGQTCMVNGSNIEQWTCNGGDNQMWQFASYNGYYQVRSRRNTSYCLDVAGGDTHTANGTNVELWTCGTSGTTKGNQTINPVATSSGGGGSGNFPSRFSAPYVPTWNDHNLANLSSSTGNKFWTLAFILSNGSCTPTWNGDTSLTGNNYGSYINGLRSAGGDAIVSFGGANGTELGLACGSVSSLQSAYQAVINQFKLTWIDLDIEGSTIGDSASVDRRNKAIHNLQAANPSLRVSYTLGVLRSGLLAEQKNLLSNAKSNGVDVDVVNIMAMDYGPCYSDMGQAAVDAASATRSQLSSLGLSAKVGVTPMIKTNDVTCEFFSTGDAQVLVNYAQANSYIGLLAYWNQEVDSGNSYVNIFKTFH